MSTDSMTFLAAIRDWVSLTAGSRPADGIRPSSRSLPVDDLLRSLSTRSAELIQAAEPSSSILEESSGSFQTLSEANWDDQFGERSELLRRFAFLCWRHSRFIGTEPEACHWLAEFDRNLGTASTDRETFDYFFNLAKADRSPMVKEGLLSTWEDLFLATAFLRGLRNRDPRLVAEEGPWLLGQVTDSEIGDQFFERDYLAADLAVSTSGAFRHLGNRDLARAWEQKARFHTERVKPRLAALELVLEYTDLANAVAEGKYLVVLRRWAELADRSLELGLLEQAAKFEIVGSAALLRANRPGDAIRQLERLRNNAVVCMNDELRAVALVQLASAQTLGGDLEGVELTLKTASTLDFDEMSPMFRGEFVWLSAELERSRGNEDGALSSLLDARTRFEELRMKAHLADVDLVLGDLLLSMGREEEARAHILAALPTIEDQKMLPQGLAALALLRESVRRRKPDPRALRELRELLQKRH